MRLALLSLLLAVGASAQAPDGLAGRWSGAAVYEGGALRLLDLEIAVGPDGLEVVLTQPYGGFARFGFPFAYEPGGPADGFLVAELFGDEMRLLVDLTDGSLRGTVVTDSVTQATVSLQRVLDYPLPGYTIEPLAFVAGADSLFGSLVLPEGPGPFPTALMVPGRGYGYGRGEMSDWALTLVRNGIATFLYDARGTGESSGVDSLTTGADRVADVQAALDKLAADPRVRADAVGIVSNSAGGWVTPLAIADRDDVAFWVALVPPAGSLAEQQSATVRRLMRDSGRPFTEAEFAAATAYQSRLVSLAAQGAPWSAYAPIIDAARAQPWAEFAHLPESLADEQLSYYARRPGFDNTDALRRMRVPTLAIFGTADRIVPPEDHVPVLEALQAGNDALNVLVLDGADHSLGVPAAAVGEGDWPAGYRRVWGRPGRLFVTLVDWTRQQIGLD
ncbi:alpha/beta hydrolase family protein [Rubrivirga sp. IMCC43871]|uniref:alpha/beta hydrolase family protein n=1 Tax=Rubrivirga sp. IMCC43871 TaxID=3391575 RepID=UPI00398FB6F9